LLTPPLPALLAPADTPPLLTPPGDAATPPTEPEAPADPRVSDGGFELQAPAQAANASKNAQQGAISGERGRRNRLIYSWING
jgi:hypothetical protein